MTTEGEEGRALSPLVQQLAADFQLLDGEVLMYEEDFESWRGRLGDVAAGDRHATCLELLALGLKFQREGGVDADPGVRQLVELAAVLLASYAHAEAVFAAAGLDPADLSRVTGGDPASKQPATSGGPAGAGSLFALRIGRGETEDDSGGDEHE